MSDEPHAEFVFALFRMWFIELTDQTELTHSEFAQISPCHVNVCSATLVPKERIIVNSTWARVPPLSN